MEVASSFIESRAARLALIVTGEVPMRLARFTVDKLKKGISLSEARSLIGALTVGDAGGAVVMGPSYGYEPSGFKLFNTSTDSNHLEKCLYRKCDDGSFEGQMMMAKIVRQILSQHNDLYVDTMAKLKWPTFDWMLTHQMGARPFKELRSLTGLPNSKMVKTFDKLGNITSATFPVNYEKLMKSGKVKSGDLIGGCFAGSGVTVGQFAYRV